MAQGQTGQNIAWVYHQRDRSEAIREAAGLQPYPASSEAYDRVALVILRSHKPAEQLHEAWSRTQHDGERKWFERPGTGVTPCASRSTMPGDVVVVNGTRAYRWHAKGWEVLTIVKTFRPAPVSAQAGA